MATIKDVAALAGVSFTTVSHVLNDTRAARADTRERVLKAARELDYVPSAVARSLKHRVTHTLGLLVPNSTNPFFAELAHGIEDACYRAGYSVVLCNSGDDPERQKTYLRVLRQKLVDGLIVASASEDARCFASVKGAPFPVIVVDRAIGGLAADLVQLDNELGGRLAAQHLASLGHRAIACVSGPAGLEVSRARVRGFRRGLAEAGLRLSDALTAEGAFTALGGHRAALELLRRAPRPTAIFACNDLMALGVLRAAAELGISVPRALSVVGFDDVELFRYTYPALTTVGHSIRTLGEATVEALLARIAHPKSSPTRRRLKPSLHARESSARLAPPRAGDAP
ncbi:MAG TPA: LacI family DNA-binding transcriptional regulator [Anaeromyxobacteraceae bacterium]|nr:LacI family DNA-binding transcriptional regulator [Anaeromyxobacteraceae bacterium]